MTSAIRTELLEQGDAESSKEIMPGEIAGLATFFHHLPARRNMTLNPLTQQLRVIIFTAGQGSIVCSRQQFAVSEIALFAPGAQTGFEIRAGGLSFIELRIDLTGEERAGLPGSKASAPYFATYSKCETYKEAIKSEKTISRTLLPETVVPRLCIGSVQTSGPDNVGAHAHPMLEQLFLGLPGNHCLVKADAAECLLSGNMLLHIPLGSSHSVSVEAGRQLHYIWIDLFRTSDMSYISNTHIPSSRP